MSDEAITPRAPGKKVPIFSVTRVWTIAMSTVTQLVRMKTFYFLLAFALLLLVVGNVSFASSPASFVDFEESFFWRDRPLCLAICDCGDGSSHSSRY